MAVYKPVRALERGLRILRVVNADAGLRTREVAARAGLSRPTVFRLLETLGSLGYVARASDGGWHPTMACLGLSAGFVDRSWVADIARPEINRLGQEVLWPLDLVTLDGDAMLIRETTHRSSPFSFDDGMPGRRIPILHTAGGHAYLAFCPAAEREIIVDMLRRSDHPDHALVREPGRLAQILDRTRRAGYGFRTEGYRPHTHSLAVPIRHEGRVLAALSVICLKKAIGFDEMTRRFAPRLVDTSATISDRLSGTLSSDPVAGPPGS